jgi:hypothetical protein
VYLIFHLVRFFILIHQPVYLTEVVVRSCFVFFQFYYVFVFVIETVLLFWNDLHTAGDVFFGGVEVFEIRRHPVDRDVRFKLIVVDVLDCIQNFIPLITLVEVIVLIPDVDNKLHIENPWHRALRHSLNCRNRNFSLNATGSFDIVKICSGKQQSPFLLHHPPIDLDHFARE